VVVGPREELLRRRVPVAALNWLGPGEGPPAGGMAVQVKLRSAQDPLRATVYGRDGGQAEVVLEEPAPGVAPGQACVIYDGDRVLGGGWISRDNTL
jgi:tRNA-specific 2-thiouridylase